MDNSIAKNRNRRLIKPARIAFVCEGDAEKDAFSGSAKSIVDNLRALGHTIFPINVRPSKPWRLADILLQSCAMACSVQVWQNCIQSPVS